MHHMMTYRLNSFEDFDVAGYSGGRRVLSGSRAVRPYGYSCHGGGACFMEVFKHPEKNG